MKAHLKEIGEKKFLLTAIVFCFIGDLWIAYYLYDKFSDRAIFDAMLKIVMSQQGSDLQMLDQNTLDGAYTLILNILMLFLSLMILLHVFNYLFFSKKKNFAFRYVTMLTWVGSPGCILAGLSMLSTPALGIPFIVQGILYGYVAMGLWHYPWNRKGH